jgi:HD-GYP domain-containing protein (c-di-GMP phosphodiesterase class II)
MGAMTTARLLADLVEEDDAYTGLHCRDVVLLSLAVGRDLCLSRDELRIVELGALLHDVGKLGVPKAIVRKAGPLSDEEWELMRSHTIHGERMLLRDAELAPVAAVVRASHERWDGAGYPDGLSGEAIPLPARIIAAADAFDAMTTNRPYRRARTLHDARREMADCAGSQFDPLVVAALLAVVDDTAALARIA